MNKHTPGPWYRQQDSDDPAFFIIRNDEGSKIATLHDPLADELSHAEELVANAALIAAAPELLEAAKYALTNLKPQGSVKKDFSGHNAMATLSRAIAKAEQV